MIWLLLIIGICITFGGYILLQSKLGFVLCHSECLYVTFAISGLLTLLIAVIALFYSCNSFNKNIETTLIPITDIYEYGDSDNFVVTGKNGKIYNIKTDRVYKSNSDFIIQYNPNVSDKTIFWFGNENCKYDIFLKDTNVPNK